MKIKNAYAGRISNSGSQHVKAPLQIIKKGKGKVIVGDDLRSGRG